MKVFPTVQDLADAPIDSVLKLWEGLGYYSRVRNMQKAAQLIVQEVNGVFPETFTGWMALPGIGRYTAGAICSIAYDQPVPVLDGNVIRVLCRYFGYRQDPKNSALNRKLWKHAEDFVQQAQQEKKITDRPCAAFNQSLMELGALVCRTQNPLCPSCPLKNDCKALVRNQVHIIPTQSKKQITRKQYWTCWILDYQGRFLVRKRHAERVNQGLWEFPTVVSKEEPKPCSLNGGNTLPLPPREWGVQVKDITSIGTMNHTITCNRIRIQICQATIQDALRQVELGIWKTWPELFLLPWGGAHLKIIHLLDRLRLKKKKLHVTLTP